MLLRHNSDTVILRSERSEPRRMLFCAVLAAILRDGRYAASSG